MQNNLLIAGIACVIAALIGGGLQAFTTNIPVLNSTARQIALGIFGAILIALALTLGRVDEQPPDTKPVSPPEIDTSSQPARQKEPTRAERQPPPPAETHQVTAGDKLTLARASYQLPDDGIVMNNATVGPFCCTGTIVVVRAANGDPVGYIYFFTWEGQAYNVEDGSIVPDLAVLVSGPRHFGDPDSDQIKKRIAFYADRVEPQSNF